MLEDRKHFIMRIQMMIQEIKMSNLDDACIHSMIDFQLRQREKNILIKTKFDVIYSLVKKKNIRSGYMTSDIVRDIGNKAFDEIINKI